MPPEPQPEFHEFIEVITGTSEGRIALIQGALDDSGIEYYLHGEAVQLLTEMDLM